MKITYDPEVDVLRIIFSSAQIEKSDEEKSGIILDFDKSGNVVAMEILNASKRIENPRAVEFAVTGQKESLRMLDGFYHPLHTPTYRVIGKRDDIYER